MSELTITKLVESDKEISKEELSKKIEEALNREFSGAKLYEDKKGDLRFKARVRTKLFNPIVSIKGPVVINANGKKAKILIDGDTTTNTWFWFTAIVFCFFPILFIAMAFMYFAQKKSSIQSLNKVFDRIEFELSAI